MTKPHGNERFNKWKEFLATTDTDYEYIKSIYIDINFMIIYRYIKDEQTGHFTHVQEELHDPLYSVLWMEPDYKVHIIHKYELPNNPHELKWMGPGPCNGMICSHFDKEEEPKRILDYD